MKFHAEEFKHEQTEKIGILLVNLGSPDAPDAGSIRRFLKEFLSDHRVIEIPQFLWQLILNFIILPFRPRKLVPLYRAIWTPEGSPLVSIAKKQKNKLTAFFAEKTAERSAEKSADKSSKDLIFLPLSPLSSSMLLSNCSIFLSISFSE